VLVNAAVRLPPPHDDVAVVGLDDPWTGAPDGDRAFAGAAGAAVTIAVCHSPGGFPHARGRGAALFLSGHTHGGQVALPGSRPVVLPGGSWARRFPHGLHRDGDTAVFVSRGVGGVELPIRTYAPPDVGVFDLG
jgi:predicted MPP superfamily phosphohydrolase